MNRGTLPWAALFAAVFGLCYGGASWITARYASLPAWDLPFERYVPFVPSLSLLYLTITPVLLLAPLFFRTRETLAPFAIALCVETLLATCCFLLFPQTTAWTRPEVTGWARVPFSIADALNLQYNEFPSLHVAFAVSAAWAYPRWKALWWTWSAGVALSAWLIWEHHLVDIAGGVALAVLVMTLLYPRVHVELLCLWQCVHFSRRHVRYFVIFLAIWLPSLLHWRRYRAVRTGFCAAQWIDDLLDGDRASGREPLEIVDELIEQMTARMFSDDPLSRLVFALFDDLNDRARDEFIALVQCMRVDRLRVLHRGRWTAQELDAHHEMTFRHSVNLMLITAGCTARASEVPSLIRVFAWCSVIRDLEEDLRKGLVNIPRGAAPAQWLRDEHARACMALEQSAREISRLADHRARRLLGIFHRSIARYAERDPLAALTVIRLKPNLS